MKWGRPIRVTERQYRALTRAVCLLDAQYEGETEPKWHTADCEAARRALRAIARSLQ